MRDMVVRVQRFTLQQCYGELQGASVLLWEDNMTIVHVLTNRTTRSPELMHLLRKLWRLLDTAGIKLEVRYIPTDENTFADYLSRGSPFDELVLRSSAWANLEAFDAVRSEAQTLSD